MRFVLLIAPVLALPFFTVAAEYKLVWSDEFDKDGSPDPAKWTYEEGFVRNEESQFYTKARSKNARVENGHLIIEAHKEKFPNPRFDSNASKRRWKQSREFADYTSASVTTKGIASWTYGKIEVRAKLPEGRGVWPAIWMLGTNIGEVGWPACGELDIMEFVGYEPDAVHFNVHTKDYNHAIGKGRGKRVSLPNAPAEWHVYTLDWTPEKLVFLLDGKPAYTLKNDGTGKGSWPFDDPEYLILNLAIGGAWGGREGIDDSIFPQKFLIDYVRVFQAE
jgi:beta-glucanase (GH16 family)